MIKTSVVTYNMSGTNIAYPVIKERERDGALMMYTSSQRGIILKYVDKTWIGKEKTLVEREFNHLISKVTIQNTAKQRNGFPKLMESESGKIVLMTKANGDGAILMNGDGDNYKIGHISNWTIQRFKDFKGKLVLQNTT